MVTSILKHVTAIPAKTQLPASIELSQRLSTDTGPEQVYLRFGLAQGNDVWFDTGDGLTKTLVRLATVDGDGKVRQEVKLVQGRGLNTTYVEIEETIFDGGGRELYDVCILKIQSSAR